MMKQEWVKKWQSCKLCPLHLTAKHHVLYRGTIPADVLIIGEAPGKTEDKLGKPFIGRSGQLLSTAIKSLSLASYCISNVVCCIPLQEGVDVRPPSRGEADACFPHLEELVTLCQPKLIVLLGKEAEKSFLSRELDVQVKVATLRHPAYILRKGGLSSLEFKKFLWDFERSLSDNNIPHRNPFDLIGV